MDAAAQLYVAAFTLEAAMEIARNLWDPVVRAVWNFTRAAVLVVAVATVVLFSSWNLVQGTGLDLEIDLVGRVLTGIALARGVYWVHEGYKRLER